MTLRYTFSITWIIPSAKRKMVDSVRVEAKDRGWYDEFLFTHESGALRAGLHSQDFYDFDRSRFTQEYTRVA